MPNTCSAPTRYTHEDWERQKPFMQRYYLTEGESATVVNARLKHEQGFHVSVRQMKQRFDRWGWQKKVICESYMAMMFILEFHDSTITFHLRKAGHKEKRDRKGPAEVRKEMNRKRKTAARTGNPLPPAPTDLRQAVLCLSDEDVLISFGAHTSTQPIAQAFADILRLHQYVRREHTPQASQRYVASPSSAGLQTPQLAEREDDTTTLSDESIPDIMPMEHDLTRELNGSNFAEQLPQHRLTHHVSNAATAPRQTDRLPHPHAFASMLTTSVLPHSAAGSFVGGFIERITIDPISATAPHDDFLDSLTRGFAKMALTMRPGGDQRRWWESFLGVKLGEHYTCFDPDSRLRMIIEFTAYYTQQCMVGYDTLDDITDSDRQEARSKLGQMLREDNFDVLSAIFFISTVLGAHDKDKQLIAFYVDCWDHIEDNTSSRAAHVFRPVIRSVIWTLSQNDNAHTNSALYSRARKLVDLRQNLNLRREFDDSIQYLSQLGQHQSATMLVLRGYQAWHLQQIGQFDDSLHIILEHLPIAEHVMGPKHLTTVNYLFLAAKCYEQQGNMLAENYIQWTLLRLDNCANPLRAYKYRLRLKLAMLQYDQYKLDAALWNAEAVLGFREQTGGATGEAAELVYKVLIRQGRDADAQRAWDEYIDRFRAQ